MPRPLRGIFRKRRHLHVLAATGLYDRKGRFHEIPVESLEPLAELFRHRFIATLVCEKFLSDKKARQLLNSPETMEPIDVPVLWCWTEEQDSATYDASHLAWQAPELPLDDERILVLDGDPIPPDEFLGS